MRDAPSSSVDAFWVSATGAVLALTVVVQTWLWLSGWFYGDQFTLYRLGIELAVEGHLFSFAKGTSGGGVIPGSLLQLLVGVPLMAALDYRMPTLASGLLQLAAVFLMVSTVRRALGARFAFAFAIVYGLSPWRLYHAGFIWEPTYLLLPAAVHFWASMRQLDAARWWPSFALGAVATASVQLHLSAVILAFASVLLVLFRIHKLNWLAAIGGGMAGALTLIPTLAAAVSGAMPSVAPGGSWHDWGIVRVFPLFKGLAYWFRLASLDLGRRLEQATTGLGAIQTAGAVVGTLSVLIVLYGTVIGVRRLRSGGCSRLERGALLYCAALLTSALTAIAVNSVTPQSWHLLVVLHAACLPATYGCVRMLEATGRWRTASLWTVWAFFVLRLPLIAVLGIGHPMYSAPPDDPNRKHVREGRFDRIEPTRTPFGGHETAPEAKQVPWE